MVSSKKRQLPFSSFQNDSVNKLAENSLGESIGGIEIAWNVVFSFLIVLACCSAPEGAIREGDFLPIAFCFLVLNLIVSLLHFRKNKTTGNVCYLKSDCDAVRKSMWFWERMADWSLLAFVIWTTLAYLRVPIFHDGDVRLSTNAYWTFIIPALLYFVFRYCAKTFSKCLILSVCGVVFACAVAESVYSIYSYAVINPQLRQDYLANPDKMLQDNGLAFESDSRERVLFEKRLLESTEPTGTYGLANTLAGFLAPCFILGMYPLWLFVKRLLSNLRLNRDKVRVFDCVAFAVLATSLILLLTVILLSKSRSGFLATCFGMGILFSRMLGHWVKRGGKQIKVLVGCFLFSCLLMVMLLCVSLGLGWIDKEVFTEAGKSLGYRLDYWRATFSIVCDYPVLGIGPGEFQNVYARYILPTASEFIADPHNFIFEIAALFGIPALFSFLLFVGSVSIVCLKKSQTFAGQTDWPDGLMESGGCNVSVLCGICAGILALFFCSLYQEAHVDFQFLCIALPVILIATISYTRLTLGKEADGGVLLFFVVTIIITLLLNLCVAGGIGYPVITIPMFLLAAIGVNANDPNKTNKVNAGIAVKTTNRRSLLYFGVSALVLPLFYYTALAPRNRAYEFQLKYNLQNATLTSYSSALQSGVTNSIDRYSSVVAIQFYYFAALEYAKTSLEASKQRWLNTREHVKTSSPHSSSVRENCGDFDWNVYLQSKKNNSIFLNSATEFYEEAVQFSPTDVNKRLKLFHAYLEQKEESFALLEAQKALELNKTTPHEDRKLSEEAQNELEDFVNEYLQN